MSYSCGEGDGGRGEGRGRGKKDTTNEPGNPPSTLRSQRTCLLGCGASARLWALGVRVVVEDVELWLTRFDVVVVEEGGLVAEVLGDVGRRFGGW